MLPLEYRYPVKRFLAFFLCYHFFFSLSFSFLMTSLSSLDCSLSNIFNIITTDDFDDPRIDEMKVQVRRLMGVEDFGVQRGRHSPQIESCGGRLS